MRCYETKPEIRVGILARPPTLNLVAFQFIGIDLTGLAIILGFLSVGIGFGLQNITFQFCRRAELGFLGLYPRRRLAILAFHITTRRPYSLTALSQRIFRLASSGIGCASNSGSAFAGSIPSRCG